MNPSDSRLLPSHIAGILTLVIFSMYQREEEKMKTFADKAYDLLRKVPRGHVTTYREIAHALGTKAYRGVGQAMRSNPYAPEVP